MDDADLFKKELEKLMPKFNKQEKKSGVGFCAGFFSWVFIALFAFASAWVVGAMIGLSVSGYRLVLRLLG